MSYTNSIKAMIKRVADIFLPKRGQTVKKPEELVREGHF